MPNGVKLPVRLKKRKIWHTAYQTYKIEFYITKFTVQWMDGHKKSHIAIRHKTELEYEECEVVLTFTLNYVDS